MKKTAILFVFILTISELCSLYHAHKHEDKSALNELAINQEDSNDNELLRDYSNLKHDFKRKFELKGDRRKYILIVLRLNFK